MTETVIERDEQNAPSQQCHSAIRHPYHSGCTPDGVLTPVCPQVPLTVLLSDGKTVVSQREASTVDVLGEDVPPGGAGAVVVETGRLRLVRHTSATGRRPIPDLLRTVSALSEAAMAVGGGGGGEDIIVDGKRLLVLPETFPNAVSERGLHHRGPAHDVGPDPKGGLGRSSDSVIQTGRKGDDEAIRSGVVKSHHDDDRTTFDVGEGTATEKESDQDPDDSSGTLGQLVTELIVEGLAGWLVIE